MRTNFFNRQNVVISDPILSRLYVLLVSKNFSLVKLSQKTISRIEELLEREKKQVRSIKMPVPLLGGDGRVSMTQKHTQILSAYLGDMSRDEIDDCFKVTISKALVFVLQYVEKSTNLYSDQEHIIYMRHKSSTSSLRYMLSFVIKDSVCSITCPEVGCIIANKGTVVYG